jgi:hypothetical protein
MKYLLLITLIFFVNIKINAQQIDIESDEKIITGTKIDTLILQEDNATDKTIRLKLTISKTDMPVTVTVNDLQLNTATKDSDYTFSILKMPSNLIFNQASNMINILNLTIKKDGISEEPEYAELDFKWASLTEKDKMFHKILLIKIFDAVKEIPKSQQKDSDTKHTDKTNTNKMELSQFTDFVGFDNDKPNGRLQQEFRFKWAIAKKWHGKEDGWHYQFLRSVLLPDILFNRIDKSQKEETYNYPAYLRKSSNLDSAAPKFTTMDIYKYSNLQIGLRAIVMAFKKDNFRFHIQGGVKLIRNKPFADTSITQNGKTDSAIFRPTYSVAYTAEVYGKTTLSEENAINLDFNAGITWLYLKDSYYRQYDAAVIDAYNKATVLLPVSYPSRKVKPIYMFSFRLTKDLSKDKDHYAYFRCNYMYQSGKYNIVEKRITNTGEIIYKINPEPVKFYNHFMQMQLGISLDLKDLFQKKSDEKKTKDSKIADSAG